MLKQRKKDNNEKDNTIDRDLERLLGGDVVVGTRSGSSSVYFRHFRTV